MSLHLIQGDITKMHVGAIVNAANSELLPGGGLCGAIHAAAGPSLAEACGDWIIANGPVPPGGAAITPGFRLPAQFVVHAVGPVWNGGHHGEPATLASAYHSAIQIADEHGVETIAFPAISTGIFGYPAENAASVALQAVADGLCTSNHVREATFVLYDEETYDIYQRAVADISWEF